ncbi:pyridoxamine 5'-phosphate oxidase [Aquimarina hainanensis]|uniref:Pyridoxamine 5'-phosphate oxidase n=1 Tax=Aquimarina hainanensis TaxID=1578017 RepID=A0ABW5N4G8_9FLAO
MKEESHNPIAHFQQWFYEVEKAHPEDEVNIMSLSTIGNDGFPKNRIVLLKRFTWEGFYFFTNYNSEKGIAIRNNPLVSLSFFWKKAAREVHIYGKATKIPVNLSQGYFDSRPRGSQLSTWASMQGSKIASRKQLNEQLAHYDSLFRNKEIPMPAYWGGYLVSPKTITFIDHKKNDKNHHLTYCLQKNYHWIKQTHSK